MCCESDEVDGTTGQLHGYAYLVAPRQPNGTYRVDIIDPSGNLFAVEGDTEQQARDRAEEWIDKRNADALFYGVMKSPRCSCAEYGGQESCGVHGKYAVHGAA